MDFMPFEWSTGARVDVPKRIAVPMVGGLFTSFLLELLVYPAVCLLWKRRFVLHVVNVVAPVVGVPGLILALRAHRCIADTVAGIYLSLILQLALIDATFLAAVGAVGAAEKRGRHNENKEEKTELKF
jgi:hypothetical protein